MNLELMPRTRNHDMSGFAVFSYGDAGQAHVMAHRMLDEGRHGLGHRLLGAWLEGRTGSGSDWTHLQWHMAVFELAVGEWDAALARFETHILPVAAHTHDALTDAPAMLWRLQLAAPRTATLAWEPVRRTAARRLAQPSDPYVELHCLLALAGAGDVGGLHQWLRSRCAADDSKAKLLTQMGTGLLALAEGDDELAAAILTAAAPKISALGGSHAQNQLFEQIAARCWERTQRITLAAA